MPTPSSNSPDNPSGAIHPSTFLTVCAGAGAGLQRLVPLGLDQVPGLAVVGKPVMLAAVLLFAWALLALVRHGTTMEHRTPTTTLVTTGPYRLSRNPMYVALALLFLGFAAKSSSAWWALAGLVFAGLVHRFTILREEAYLDRTFGEEYARYRRSVRRWL